MGRRSAVFATFILLLSVFFLGACSLDEDVANPRSYPFTLDIVESAPAFYAVDLTGNGRDERVRKPVQETDAWSHIKMYRHDGRTIDQVNFAGEATKPHFEDANGDGRLEMFVPVLHNDSLSLVVVDAQGQKREQIFIMSGEPREEAEGEIPWKAAVRDVHFADVTRDGEEELITAAVTHLARTPRGIFVHSFPEGDRLGRYLMGGYLRSPTFLVESENDKGVLFSTYSVNNGAQAGGLSDRSSHVGFVGLTGKTTEHPSLVWAEQIGGLWSSAKLHRERFTGLDDEAVIVHEGSQKGRPSPDHLRRIDPLTGETEGRRRIPESTVVTADVLKKGTKQILALDDTGRLRVFNGALELMQERQVLSAGGTENEIGLVVVDATGEGGNNVFVHTTHGSRLLDEDLRVQAVLPDAHVEGVMQRGGSRPDLLVNRQGRFYVASLDPNVWWPVYRYGPWVLGLVGLAVLLGVGETMWRLRRRNQLLETVHEATPIVTEEQGLALVHPDPRVEPIGHAARSWLGIEGERAWVGASSSVRGQKPELDAFFDRLRERPPRPVEQTLHLEENGDAPETLHVRAEPLPGRYGERGYWAVTLRPETVREPDYRAWGLMARRVAHDLKNPLTSILLTLQRMQMEYREQVPGLADDLDDYTTQIEERIEHLRRMATNVMKFVDLEKPVLTKTDLNEFVRQQDEHFQRRLPSDIDLALKLSDSLPAVDLDADQMQSVVENLVSNAVEALPSGGKITLATLVERDLQTSPDAGPDDYVVLEVRDTGTGMKNATQQHLFEPGFTTREDGTGLGLAIVKKIVDDHDGHIEVDTDPGIGSAFCIYLPVCNDEGTAGGDDAQRDRSTSPHHAPS
jgi:signal transduction histidine kinase